MKPKKKNRYFFFQKHIKNIFFLIFFVQKKNLCLGKNQIFPDFGIIFFHYTNPMLNGGGRKYLQVYKKVLLSCRKEVDKKNPFKKKKKKV